MIQNKTAHVQLHLIFPGQHMHSNEEDVGTFYFHAIFRNSVKLFAHKERFDEKPNLVFSGPLVRYG